ncbi:MAG TPA: hypothetical protein VFJ02_20725, partial [Vicinamibacterales bacterium]|nr:hypothetical protein [Vicinamibacterales bacterium]
MVLLLLVVIAFAVGFFLVFGGYFGATKLPGWMLQRKLEARLEEVTAVEQTAVGEDGSKKAIVKNISQGPLPGIDRMIAGTTRGSALGRWLEQSGVKTSVSAILLIACGLAAAGALLVMF